MDVRSFAEGDLVVFRMEKCTTKPGQRANDVRPAPRGDTYTYHVDKYWIVERRIGDTLVLRTPTGKHHDVPLHHPCLRRPRWLERLWLHTRGRRRLERLVGDGRG